jgi:TnpA family transposase
LTTPEIILTNEQRLEFTRIPDKNEYEIAKHYTFSIADLEIINKHRRDYNRLGFAVQLCLLRYPGWSLGLNDVIPETVLSFIADQLKVGMKDYKKYFNREKTRLSHFQELRKLYGYTLFLEKDRKKLFDYLLPFAMENDNILRLINVSIYELRQNKVILPGITTIEKIVGETRIKANDSVIKIINDSLTPDQKKRMDILIESPNETAKTIFAWLKADQGQSSPTTFLDIIEKLKKIRELELSLNIKDVHPNRIRQLSRLGSKYEPHLFRRFDENKRYAMLALYLNDLSQRLIDLAVDIHDKQINILLSKGRKRQEQMQIQNGKMLNEKMIHFVDIGSALIKAKNENLDPYKTIEAIMSWEKVIASVEEAQKMTRPANYDYLDLIDNRYSQLRKYTPALVRYLEFSSTNSSLLSLIESLKVINEMNEKGKRVVPENAPLGFLSNRWKKYVIEKDGSINRHYYEMAAFTELKNRIRSGDVAVTGSRVYKNFDEYLITKNEWIKEKQTSTKLAVNIKFEEYFKERTESLNTRLDWISKNYNKLDGVTIDADGIHVEKLEKDTPEEAKSFSEKLYNMLPRIKLPYLLLEVASWTNFDKNFIHASTGKPIKNDEKSILMASIMAMGTNIGLVKMADSTPGITYRQMANIAQWRMYDEAMARAQATLVNFQHKQFLSNYWGDGSTSSSDGMRVQVGVSSLNAEHNPHYGSEKGTTMYRFVNDQFSSFYTKIINTNARDAVHVIDGLLYHETELSINEHFTDTAGYTDQIFGLCHLLGFRFAPRIRDISELILYSINKPGEYQKIEQIIQGKINIKIIQENYDDILRLAHSIQTGKVTGSLIMSKLCSYARQNSLATALREMGRIEKTIFILDYISDEPLRRRIQRGLNIGEAINALARIIFFGKRGELRERDLQDQLQRASALNIIINAISIWNTAYLKKATDYMKANNLLNEKLIKHISPIGWEHINFLGEYSFDLKKIIESDKLRPLNLNNIR